MLETLRIKPDGVVGHSAGEVGCGYGDGGLTAEEALLCAYWRGQCLERHKLAPGAMAAVGKFLPQIATFTFLHAFLLN